MKSPFFSIIIPTKDREDTLVNTFWSIGRQDFHDYEVLVIDNSDSALHTAPMRALSSLANARCIRTGGLAMPDNWEIGFGACSGRYVLVVTDRCVLSSKHVLSACHALLRNHNEEVLSWRFCNIDEAQRSNAGRTGKWGKLRTRSIAQQVLHGQYDQYKYSLARGLNSCISRALISRIRDSVGRVCPPIAPDYTLAFQVLFKAADVVHIDSNLVYGCSRVRSTGFRSRSLLTHCRENCKALAGGSAVSGTEHVPIKFTTVNNIIYNDFLSMAKTHEAGLSWSDISRVPYYTQIYRELMTFSVNETVQAEFREWGGALSGESRSVSREVLQQALRPMGRLRRLLFRTRLLPRTAALTLLARGFEGGLRAAHGTRALQDRIPVARIPELVEALDRTVSVRPPCA